MNKKNWNLCPALRYARSHAHQTLERFRLADAKTREELITEAVIAYGLIHNVAQPLAFDVGGTDYALLWEELKTFWRALIGGNPEFADTNFPPDGNRQLILDRLDDLRMELRKLEISLHLKHKKT